MRLARRLRLVLVCFALGAATAPDVARPSYAEHSPLARTVRRAPAFGPRAQARPRPRPGPAPPRRAAAAPPAAFCRSPFVRKRCLAPRALTGCGKMPQAVRRPRCAAERDTAAGAVANTRAD